MSVELQYRITGMDCADCAARIAKAARTVQGVEDVRVSIATERLTVRLADDTRRQPALERVVGGLGYRLDRLDERREYVRPRLMRTRRTNALSGSSSCSTSATVAVAIAALFLHSAAAIVSHALIDLREPRPGED